MPQQKKVAPSRKYETPLKRRFAKAKAAAEKRGIEWDLSFDMYCTVLESLRCHYCRTSLTDKTGSCLDRIDSNKPYQFKNVLPCCGTCNRIKAHELTVAETKVAVVLIKLIRRYFQ